MACTQLQRAGQAAARRPRPPALQPHRLPPAWPVYGGAGPIGLRVGTHAVTETTLYMHAAHAAEPLEWCSTLPMLARTAPWAPCPPPAHAQQDHSAGLLGRAQDAGQPGGTSAVQRAAADSCAAATPRWVPAQLLGGCGGRATPCRPRIPHACSSTASHRRVSLPTPLCSRLRRAARHPAALPHPFLNAAVHCRAEAPTQVGSCAGACAGSDRGGGPVAATPVAEAGLWSGQPAMTQQGRSINAPARTDAPRSMPRADKVQRVEALVDQLGLSTCAHTTIGSVLRRWVGEGGLWQCGAVGMYARRRHVSANRLPPPPCNAGASQGARQSAATSASPSSPRPRCCLSMS